MFTNKTFSIFLAAMLISGCGGGGGGGGGDTTAPVTPAPTVSISADPLTVLLTNASTITWSSTNATSCSASGSWSGTKTISGSEAVTISTTGNNTYTLSCTGAGGSRSSSVTVEGFRNTDGVVVDGYISGAEVFIDEDDDWVADSNESSTTSDNDGKFTIKYANGNLVSIGGTDLDSQTLLDNLLITHKLTGHSDFKAVTPVTSVAAFMTEASNINSALGIDSSIDVFTFDPVANKGDGGINDYLYEKGNQLTTLAYAFQNITNNLNTTTQTTQDYFKAITEEIEKEYTETTTKVDIETEAFIKKALDNVIAAKTLTIADEAKANTTKALSGVMPVIEVKSSNDLTTSVIRFAVSTLQTDIKAIANGTASAETLTSYTTDVLNYIATDQNIDANEITPDISAIADSASTSEDTAVDITVLANDSFITTAPITVTAANGSNGSSAVTSNVITYTPNADFNGTDTFSYTITQGDKTSSADVSISIEAVNDAPSIDIASTIQAAENQRAVTTISTSDVDEDDLALTISGANTNSFDLSADNVLTFKAAPDFETKSSYSIILSLTDGTETVTKDLTVAITNVNDIAPKFTSEAIFSADENQTSIGTVTATDEEGDDITFTVSGSELTITSAGVLIFVSAPDYETKSSYTATVTASDGINSATQDVTVNINDIDENINAPSFTSNTIFTADENQTSIGTVTATDEEGDDIAFTVSGSELSITSAGVLTFKSDPDYETKSSYTATVTANDGKNSATQDIIINVTNVNDIAPELTSAATFSADENQTSIGIVTAIDSEGDAVTFSVSGRELAITLAGVLTFKSDPDYETKSSYTATVTASDGFNSATQDIIINVTNVNDIAPELTSAATFSADENQTAIGTVTATDAEVDDITFTISGSELTITSAGALTFVSAPDYETKSSYTATVTAYDGKNSATQDIAVNVINVNDIAPIFGSTEYSVAEQETTIGLINVSDEEGDSISLSLSGGDASAFILDSVLRTIKFTNPPIYATKDSYETTITALDGSYSLSKNLTVSITELGYLTIHPQATLGTDGDDSLSGNDGKYDILIGGRGDDILTGGESRGSSGGYVINIFQFTDNSGKDIITDFFIQELWLPEEQCANYNSQDGRCITDRLEITTNINNTGISSANEILENSTDNSNGYAVINLGQGNTITLEGVAINEIKPEHIHIIPIKAKVVQGEGTFTYESPSGQDDIIQPLQFNTRMEGSKAPFDRTDDGYDILNSGIGDDVLIGGTNDNNQGGVIDFYKFYDDSGNDLIIGYYDMQFSRDLDSGYTTNGQGSGRKSDKIIIPININGTLIDSFADIKSRSSNNLDGWAKLDLGLSNYITVHGVPFEKLTSDSFIFTYSETYNEVYGENINTTWEQENNIIQGTSSNDWISGSKRFLPWRGTGIDYIFPGSGNDILISGIPVGASFDAIYKNFYITNFFINKPGKKTIIGFSARGSEIYNPYTEAMLDRIFISSTGSNNYLSDLSIRYDDDGFLTLLIDSQTEVKLHSIDQGEIDPSNIIIHKPFDSYKYGTLDDDYLVGSSGNDYIDGWSEYKIAPPSCKGISSGSDILEGKEGDDVLVGGVSFHWCGGFNRDTFKFSDNSGNDRIVDFTSNFELPGYVNFFHHMDVLEIEENINGISFRTAQELLDISTDNVDGFAQIQLGGSNTITLHDKSISTISPIHFRIIPKIDSYLVGTDGDDVLTGDEFNNYIKGSNTNLGRYSKTTRFSDEDGYDILDGGAGDDVLDGGNYKRSNGGYVIDLYKFDKNYGYDRIFNFFALDIKESYGGPIYTYYESGIRSNKIEIPNDVVTSATTLINSSSNNADGYAHLSFSGTDIIIDMISKEQLKPDYFFITPRATNTIIGTSDNDYLVGTDLNDRIHGTINPFIDEDNGSDFIEGGKGDDILIGGPAERTNGGYASNKYRFNDNFGHDYLISFFAEDINPGYSAYQNPEGEGAAKLSDKLEFNNIFGSTATDIINKASDNEDGWAVITLGANSLTIHGISSEDLKPDYFYIIPTIENTILGTDDDGEEESHTGTSGNDYIQGGSNSLFSHSDGPDILNGKEGDDVLIGGPNGRRRGGFNSDTYVFEANSGNDLIIGFLFDGTGYFDEYNDVMEIPININGSGISSYEDVINSTSDNDDGWAVINLGSSNSITLHGVSKSELLKRNFIIR